ncbi:MAG TPA: hypothetical protein VNA24_37750 [Hyalangium sp.]|nr:hypothetical protein [Hyalangium sp.]
MKLKKIDPRRSTEQTSSPQSAGLKVKSHVKAGLGTVALAVPKFQNLNLNLGALAAQPVFVCG